jgi:hypothetical protein
MQKDWITRIDEIIPVFPPRVISQIIVDYLLKKPFLFDLHRVFTGEPPDHYIGKLFNQEVYVSIDDLELKSLRYSRLWIYVLSRHLVRDIRNAWTFIVNGRIFCKLYFGLCRVNNDNTTCQIVDAAVIHCECVDEKERETFFCHINKLDQENEIHGKVKFFDEKNTTIDFSLKINADDLYFFVTTGYMHQNTRVINPPYSDL